MQTALSSCKIYMVGKQSIYQQTPSNSIMLQKNISKKERACAHAVMLLFSTTGRGQYGRPWLHKPDGPFARRQWRPFVVHIVSFVVRSGWGRPTIEEVPSSSFLKASSFRGVSERFTLVRCCCCCCRCCLEQCFYAAVPSDGRIVRSWRALR